MCQQISYYDRERHFKQQNPSFGSYWGAFCELVVLKNFFSENNFIVNLEAMGLQRYLKDSITGVLLEIFQSLWGYPLIKITPGNCFSFHQKFFNLLFLYFSLFSLFKEHVCFTNCWHIFEDLDLKTFWFQDYVIDNMCELIFKYQLTLLPAQQLWVVSRICQHFSLRSLKKYIFVLETLYFLIYSICFITKITIFHYPKILAELN